MLAQLDKEYIKTRPSRALVRMLSYALFEGRPLTTRGRWINPVLFGAGKIISSLPIKPIIKEPIFIVGTGRSGTTILGKILSMHSDIGYLNEPKLMWHIAYPKEDINGNYTNENASYRLHSKDATAEVSVRIKRLYGIYLKSLGNTRVLDKYPEMIFRIPFLLKLFPDARIIFIARNGVSTCKSIEHWSMNHGSHSPAGIIDWWGLNNRKWEHLVDQLIQADPLLADNASYIKKFESDVDKAAVEWILSMREGLEAVDRWPQSLLKVRYEDLLDDTENVFDAIFSFLHLKNDVTVKKYAQNILKKTKHECRAISLDKSIQPAFRNALERLNYDYPSDQFE